MSRKSKIAALPPNIGHSRNFAVKYLPFWFDVAENEQYKRHKRRKDSRIRKINHRRKKGQTKMNKAILMGRLTKDIEMRYTQSGKAVGQFSLAVDKYVGGEKSADFINCVAWEKTAETISKYCGKGRQILVEGRLQSRSYEKDGQKRYITEVIVSHMEFCGNKQGGDKTEDEPSDDDFGGVDEEIPF